MASSIDELKAHLKNFSTGVFEVRGPAGAGKTYTLVEIVKELDKQKKCGIVISFSNIAVEELNTRMIQNSGAYISTSHAFAWKWLKQFYSALLEDETFVPESGIWKALKEQRPKNIVYLSSDSVEQATNDEKILTHFDVLDAFSDAFKNSDLFRKKVFINEDYIFVDEYQDTDSAIMNALLDYGSKDILVGLFGDPMQAVNPGRKIKTLPDDVTRFNLTTNYRSGKKLVPFFNSLRLESAGLDQISPDDMNIDGELIVISAVDELTVYRKKYLVDELGISEYITLSAGHVGNLMSSSNLAQGAEILQWLKEKLKEILEIDIKISDLVSEGPSLPAMRLLLGVLVLDIPIFDVEANRYLRHAFDITDDKDWPGEQLLEWKQLLNDADYTFITELNHREEETLFVKSFFEYMHHEHLDISGKKIYEFLTSEIIGASTINGVKGSEMDNVIVNIDKAGNPSAGLNNIDFSRTYGDTGLRANYLFYVAVTRAKKKIIIYINEASMPKFAKTLSVHLAAHEIEHTWYMFKEDTSMYLEKK